MVDRYRPGNRQGLPTPFLGRRPGSESAPSQRARPPGPELAAPGASSAFASGWPTDSRPTGAEGQDWTASPVALPGRPPRSSRDARGNGRDTPPGPVVHFFGNDI